jgi:hypothetical protein
MLTAGELSQLRSDIDEFLPDTCIIRRATLAAPDARGLSDPSPVAVGTIICRVDPFNKQRDSNLLGTEFGSFRVASRSWYMLTLKHNADIDDADNIDFNGKIYQVLRVFDDHSNRAVKRVLIVRLEGETSL